MKWTYVTPTEGYLRVHFTVRDGPRGFLGSIPREHFEVDRARVCLACGHVSLGLGAKTLARLRREAASLEPCEGQ
jgi:hypothetical protein